MKAAPFAPQPTKAELLERVRYWSLDLANRQQLKDVDHTIKLAEEYLHWHESARIGKQAVELAARHSDRDLAACCKRVVAYAKYLTGASQE